MSGIVLNDRHLGVLAFLRQSGAALSMADLYEELDEFELFPYQCNVLSAVRTMEKNGYLSVAMECHNNRKRKLYSLSDKGVKVLKKQDAVELTRKLDISAHIAAAFKVSCCSTRIYNTRSSTSSLR